MLPAAIPVGTAVKPAQLVTAQTALRTSQPQAPETARASAGEAAAANVRTETPNAVQAAEQSSVAPRLRDQETAERTDRETPANDAPVGPEPSFEESPLERQARVALDPPDASTAEEEVSREDTSALADSPPHDKQQPFKDVNALADPPPTPAERAEASFSETKSIAEPKEPTTVDVAR